MMQIGSRSNLVSGWQTECNENIGIEDNFHSR
jgi:hypothetical protein